MCRVGIFWINVRATLFPKSVDAFKQAAGKDPEYAAAYAGLADAYNLIAFYGLDPSLNSVSRAKIAADKAIELDDSLAAGACGRGLTPSLCGRAIGPQKKNFSAHWNWTITTFPPISGMRSILRRVGAPMNPSAKWCCETLDPVSPAAYSGLAYMQYFARNYDQAIESAHTALQLNPHSIPAHAVLGGHPRTEKLSAAIEELQTAANSPAMFPFIRALARAYALSGNRDKAAAILDVAQKDKTQQEGAGTALASAYLAVGDQERALYWLGLTAAGDIQANWLRVDPAFDSLRQNPRFIAVVDRIGTEKN